MPLQVYEFGNMCKIIFSSLMGIYVASSTHSHPIYLYISYSVLKLADFDRAYAAS